MCRGGSFDDEAQELGVGDGPEMISTVASMCQLDWYGLGST